MCVVCACMGGVCIVYVCVHVYMFMCGVCGVCIAYMCVYVYICMCIVCMVCIAYMCVCVCMCMWGGRGCRGK